MTPEQKEECSELRKELMAMQADYKDLNKKLFKWSEHFFVFWKQISNVNGKENKDE